jgi:hypothetical protein
VKQYQNWVGGLRRFFSRLWWKPLLVLTAASLLIQEQYPFSDFPMYSTFGPKTYYLYLADGAGVPIPVLTVLGMRTTTLKKVFATEIRKEREHFPARPKRLTPAQKQAVGERLLARLKASPAAKKRGRKVPNVLRLYEVNISLVEGHLDKQTELIAEHR